jgi:hypothetical protein
VRWAIIPSRNAEQYKIRSKAWGGSILREKFGYTWVVRSVKLGTIFEDSPLSLDRWLCALWMLVNDKCRYEPHILLVGQNTDLQIKSSDAVLHTVHMDGAATFNLPFPFTNQVASRNLSSPDLVNLKRNGGHVWMNAEVIVRKWRSRPRKLSPLISQSGKKIIDSAFSVVMSPCGSRRKRDSQSEDWDNGNRIVYE